MSQNPLDPDGDGLTFLPEGEVYFIEDSVSIFGQVGTRYQLFKPLSLEKYRNGQRLDSVCNQEIAIRLILKVSKAKTNQLSGENNPG